MGTFSAHDNGLTLKTDSFHYVASDSCKQQAVQRIKQKKTFSKPSTAAH
jgi:hypothetical protein